MSDEHRGDNAVLQARCHAQEARTQASIVREIYHAAGAGHLGGWNGAKPVVELITKMADALLDCSERQTLTDCTDKYGTHYQSEDLTQLVERVRQLPEIVPEGDHTHGQ